MSVVSINKYKFVDKKAQVDWNEKDSCLGLMFFSLSYLQRDIISQNKRIQTNNLSVH